MTVKDRVFAYLQDAAPIQKSEMQADLRLPVNKIDAAISGLKDNDKIYQRDGVIYLTNPSLASIMLRNKWDLSLDFGL